MSNPLDTLTSLYGEDLAHAQRSLEAEAYELGAERFLNAMTAKAERGEAADTKVARPLIADLVPKLTAALGTFMEKVDQGKPGRKHAAAKFLRGLNRERVAFITLRVILNNLARYGSRKDADQLPTLVRVTTSIGAEIEDEARFGRIRDEHAGKYRRFIASEIAKRSSDTFRRAYVRAVESAMVDAKEHTEWQRWSEHERALVGLKMMELTMESTGLVQLDQVDKGSRKDHKVVVAITEQYDTWLTQRGAALAAVSPTYLPCVVPPKPWVSHIGGGYWMNNVKSPLKLIRGGAKRNRRYRDVDLTNVLAALNKIQDTPWRINQRVLEVAQQVMAMPHPPVQKMPGPEKLPKPDRLEGMDEDPTILRQWKKAAAGQYRRETARKSRRMQLDTTIFQAKKFAGYDRIWFPYSLDFRGRIYAVTKFSPQGSDIDKGLLLFADPPEIGEDGVQWLKMHGANVAGMDKEEFADRLKWVDDNEEMILDIAENPLDNLWWAEQADSPFCFLAFCFEWAAYKKQGPAYRCGLAIAFDGSCSGIQHFSAMLRDEVGGAAVNLIPSEKPQDIYRIVAEKVIAMLNDDLGKGEGDFTVTQTDEETGEIREVPRKGVSTLALTWLQYGVTRKVTKRSVMTLAYGSKQFGFADQLLEDIIQPAIDEHGEGIFPHPRECAQYMAKLIWKALATSVVAAVEAMEWLQAVASVLAKEDMPCHWVTPIGFPVWQDYRVDLTKRIDTVICGSLRVTMTVSDGDIKAGSQKMDRYRQVNGISPNFVHSMDASHLMLTVLEASQQGVQHFATIHDSFGTAPGLAGVMFKAVRECMIRTYMERDVIEDFYNTFDSLLSDKSRDKIPAFPAKGNLDLELIRSSQYCFA